MNKNVELPKIEFGNIFKIIIKFDVLYLLISLTLLLDVYLINIFNFGLINLNTSILFNINNIKHIFFFSIIFGITFNQVSRWLCFIYSKILGKWLYKPDINLIYYLLLKRQAIENKDYFLMNYVRDESKKIKKTKLNYQVMYTLLISIIINISENNSISRETLEIFYLINNIIIKIYFGIILFMIIGIVLISIYYSIVFDEENIYYKK
jgi:hypothetical protein